MPEAVASNSIPVSDRQPRFGWKQHFSEQFEEIDYMLRAFNEMNTALYQTRQDHSESSYGIFLIHGLIMDRLTAVSREVDRVFVGAALVEREGAFSIPLMERISAIVSAAFRDGGRNLPEDGRDWSEQDHSDYMAAVTDYYSAITSKAGVNDMLEVGSLLPWLELKARRELGCAEPVMTDDASSLRDRLIADQAKSGVTAADISQAFNLRRGAVERIIARLTVEEEDGRKAV